MFSTITNKKTKIALAITLSLLLCLSCFLLSVSKIGIVKAESKTIVVPDDFPDLVDAVGNATEGDTIFVRKGTYEIVSPDENDTLLLFGIEIGKTLSIIGEDPENTKIVFPPDTRTGFPLLFSTKRGFNVTADDFEISNLTVTNCDFGVIVRGNGAQVSDIITSSLVLDGSFSTVSETILGDKLVLVGSNQTVTQCTIRGTMDIDGSQNNIVRNAIEHCYLKGSGNTLSDNSFSMLFLEHADLNIIHNNTLSCIHIGSYGHECSNNTVSGNTLDGCYIWGILMGAGSYNIFHDNLIWNYGGSHDGYGIAVGGVDLIAEYNTFYRNTLMNNNKNVGTNWEILGVGNYWDNGIEGNYWDDYNGLDDNGDGIGDTSYTISENNQDNYPLMAPIKCFDAGTWEGTPFNVDVVSNSTVVDFSFDPENNRIQFIIDGEENTTGFCRVTIPKNLLTTQSNWGVLINGASITPSVNEDTVNTYIYFTYSHSTKTVEIIGTYAIPEFPLWFILPLFLVATLVCVVFKKRLFLSDAIQSKCD